MSVTKRFTLILGGLLLGLVAVFASLHVLEKRVRDQEIALFQAEQETLLKHWLQADAQSLLEETRGWAELRSQGQTLTFDPSSASPTQSLWELTSSGALVAHGRSSLPLSNVALFKSTEFRNHALRPEGGWFYFKLEQEFYQASFARIESSAGWLLLVQKWDHALIKKLGSLLGGQLALEPSPGAHPPLEGQYKISTELKDWRGLPLNTLTLTGTLPPYQSQWSIAKAPTALFLGFGAIVIFTMALGLHRWVITPLNDIKTSLITDSIKPVEPYLKRTDEIGHLAKLVESSRLQREALLQSEEQLQSALDERIRIGRDLHDGVIQSLYATGMVLSAVQASLPPDDDSNRTTIGQCRATLNESILDLRNFITGLEPEALKQPSFTVAVTNLLNFAATANGVKTKCEIDEDLARELTITQRAHVLQITREALSNAQRHGEASEVSTQLFSNGSSVEFHFRDNGLGFSIDESSASHGHGLENLANRARELGATFTVDSQLGKGTHLKLMFEHTLQNQS